MVEPGVYDRTSAGGFAIGRLDGATDPSLEEIGRVLEAVGPVTQTQNLRGARWSKLAINCAISTLGTIGGDPEIPARTGRARRVPGRDGAGIP